MFSRRGKRRRADKRMQHVGRGHQPAQSSGVRDHASLLECALIPAPHYADYFPAAASDVEIRELKILPASLPGKTFDVMDRRKLLARVVAVQAIDNLREHVAPPAKDLAISVHQ